MMRVWVINYMGGGVRVCVNVAWSAVVSSFSWFTVSDEFFTFHEVVAEVDLNFYLNL